MLHLYVFCILAVIVIDAKKEHLRPSRPSTLDKDIIGKRKTKCCRSEEAYARFTSIVSSAIRTGLPSGDFAEIFPASEVAQGYADAIKDILTRLGATATETKRTALDNRRVVEITFGRLNQDKYSSAVGNFLGKFLQEVCFLKRKNAEELAKLYISVRTKATENVKDKGVYYKFYAAMEAVSDYLSALEILNVRNFKRIIEIFNGELYNLSRN